MSSQWRPTTAEVDLSALRANTAAFVELVSPALVCAVVKADGYGHGAVPSAMAALAGGASWLGVALVEEAVELRDAGIAAPILVLSEFPDAAAGAIAAHDITPTVYSATKIDLLAAEAAAAGINISVHIKIDTGMHRVGASPADVPALVSRVHSHHGLTLGGVFTHLAMADDPADPYTNEQLARFSEVLAEIEAEGIDAGIVHAANSAGALAHRAARYDMVRVGVALYGNDPDASLRAADYGVALQPVLTLRSAVSHVQVLHAGDRLSYGLRHTFSADTVVATVPIGYADGITRRYSAVGGDVLIGGRRRLIVGRITMDQIMVDCGPPTVNASAATSDPVKIGDEVVLIGSQGNERITPWEMAAKLDTIAYEITCGISARVPRTYGGSGQLLLL